MNHKGVAALCALLSSQVNVKYLALIISKPVGHLVITQPWVVGSGRTLIQRDDT